MSSLIIVDIQPFYEPWHNHITDHVMQYVNRNCSKYEKVVWFFNDADVGVKNDVDDMVEFVYTNGVKEDCVEQINFVNKQYMFFRDWMDVMVDEEFIIKVARYMIRNGITDSKQIDENTMEMLILSYFDTPEGVNIREEYDYLFKDSIKIPSFDWSQLQELGEVDTCGGGRYECLLEIEILLKVVGVKVNRIELLVYG